MAPAQSIQLAALGAAQSRIPALQPRFAPPALARTVAARAARSSLAEPSPSPFSAKPDLQPPVEHLRCGSLADLASEPGSMTPCRAAAPCSTRPVTQCLAEMRGLRPRARRQEPKRAPAPEAKPLPGRARALAAGPAAASEVQNARARAPARPDRRRGPRHLPRIPASRPIPLREPPRGSPSQPGCDLLPTYLSSHSEASARKPCGVCLHEYVRMGDP